jgi:phage terminase large subunit
MARKKQYDGAKELQLSFGEVSEKQKQFLEARTFFVCYGGARGGGKSHVARLKAVGMALNYPGIRILMVRAHYPELEENIIRPILRWVPEEIYSYNGTSRLMTFDNGSIIKFGHYDGDSAENEYQGVEYDVVFVDEATQLSERAFRYLQTVIRGVNEFPKRFYLTCNPGGIGHRWVKRLFIDRQYENHPDDPERTENPDDYTFIAATVDDNPWLLQSSPMYVRQLANMPEDLRRAHRYGDWDALGGNYFKNFDGRHICKPFAIPRHWPIYRSFDYGLDRFSIIWWAVDEDGRSWAFRHYEAKDLVIEQAVAQALSHTLPGERVTTTYAPWDMWNRMKDSGRAMAELFFQYGLPIVRASNNRVQGHMVMKDMLQPVECKDKFVRAMYPEAEKLPGLMFFDTLASVISDIRDIQADDKNPNDCALDPHDVTHSVDACRYYCISRQMAAEAVLEKTIELEEEEERYQDYESAMCGGEITASYMAC